MGVDAESARPAVTAPFVLVAGGTGDLGGDTVSAADIAASMTQAGGTTYRTLRVGGVNGLRRLIPLVRRLAPEKPDPVFPAWQGMAYTLDMFDGAVRLAPLDNDRYPGMRWTSLHDRFTGGHLPGGTPRQQRRKDER